MAFMMPVVKNDWDIYKSQRSRRTSESADRAGPGGTNHRFRKVSESRSEGQATSPRSTAALPTHRSSPAMRSLSYVRTPSSRASLRAPETPRKEAVAPPKDKFHSRLVEKLKRALGKDERDRS